MGLGDLSIPMTKGNINHGSVTEKINIMSRSRKKAIYKDRGHRKEDYWRAYRRTNNQIVRFFYKSATHRTSCYDSWDDYLEYMRKFKEQGYSEEEASMMTYMEVEDNEDFPICSNFHQDWAEEPNVKSPKEVINDYDYSDFRVDYEYMKRKGYFYEHTSDGYSEEWYKERQEQAKVMRRK